jgi:hypothetical protein
MARAGFDRDGAAHVMAVGPLGLVCIARLAGG